MDRVLHQQRLDGKIKRTTRANWQDLPNGAMVKIADELIAKSSHGALLWSFDGYSPCDPIVTSRAHHNVTCLTPPAILTALSNGYAPHWHPSAEMG
jgi:hypothetical protein